MAEMIQGQLTIVHQIKEGTPTGKVVNFCWKFTSNSQETPDQKDGVEKRYSRLVRFSSGKRRVATMHLVAFKVL